MTLHDERPDGDAENSGQMAPAARGAPRLPQSISELRAGQRTLSAMLMRLFDELDHRRLQLVEQSRGSAAERSTSRTTPGGLRAADEQIAALERALAAAQTHHAQRLAEFAVTRIELAAARIELKQAAGPRAVDPAGACQPEPDALSAELEILRSSAVELARELSESRRQANPIEPIDSDEHNGHGSPPCKDSGQPDAERRRRRGDLQEIHRLLGDTRGAAAGSDSDAERRSGVAGDQAPELLK